MRKRGTAAVAGVAGARLQEAVNINLGLLSLKNVISHLHRKADYVPFSDNRLTELLRTIPFLSSPLFSFFDFQHTLHLRFFGLCAHA